MESNANADREKAPVQRPGLESDTPCDRCGRFGAHRFGDRALCEDCYASSGSCCPEFGSDDLWPENPES